jgi:hypothetical protein
VSQQISLDPEFDPISQLTTGIARLRTIVPPLPPSEILDPILAQLHKLLFELWVEPTNSDRF